MICSRGVARGCHVDQKRADAIAEARALREDASRPDAVATVHANGRLTARERINALLDPGSAVPYGTIAAYDPAAGEWIGEAGGVDVVGSIDGQTVVASSTDYTDHGGGYGANRLTHLFALAEEHRWPLVLFVDGGGSRARHPRAGQGHIEVAGPIGRFSLFDGMAQLSGWTPTLGVVSGPSFAGHASLAAFCDFLIATRGSSIGMGGPPMVEAALGIRVTAHELAPVEMHDVTGGIDLLVDDEPAAIAAVRRYLSYRQGADSAGPSSSADAIADLVPESGPYDVHAVIDALMDAGGAFELRPNFGQSVVTALARMDGRSVGVMACQPAVEDGAITPEAATKIARFVELCDAYHYPIISLVDTPGFTARWPADEPGGPDVLEPGFVRAHARTLMNHHHRTAPLFSVQLRRAGRLGAYAMGGFGNGRSTPVLRLGWPTIDLDSRDGYSAFDHANAFDDIIQPSETRARLIGMLRHHSPRVSTSKSHPIDTF